MTDNQAGPDRKLSFAELVAQTALSYLEQRHEGPVRTLVEQIVAGAVAVIPGTVAAAVENLDDQGKLRAPVIEGDDVARAVMDAQNATGQGPCLDALKDRKPVLVDDLHVDARWPEFARLAKDMDVRSMVCVPMEAGGRAAGVLSLISRGPHFLGDEDTEVMASVFATHAAIAMTGAGRVDDVLSALDRRDVIGQAKGILMERFKMTPELAFATLIRTSQLTNSKLFDVCAELCRTGVLQPDPPRRSRGQA